jgi:hypothetical protein
MITNWRERIVAATIHFFVTLLVAAMAASLIFFVWFPGALATMVGGARLFFLVVTTDLVLGPLISLVIYSSAKSRGKLIFDYIVIGVLQLAAVVYGLSIVAQSRPVFVAFDGDRLEIVTAIEIDAADLKAGTQSRYRSLSWTGYRLVSVQRPTDPKEQQAILFQSIAGKEAYLMPKYYGEYDAARPQILSRLRPLDTLLKGSGAAEPALRKSIRQTGRDEQSIKWLLLHHRFGFAIALLDAATGAPVKFIAIDPEWIKE